MNRAGGRWFEAHACNYCIALHTIHVLPFLPTSGLINLIYFQQEYVNRGALKLPVECIDPFNYSLSPSFT